MKWLSDKAVDRLREAVETPDLTGTPYRIIRRIARGGMGAVFLAEDARLDRKVAIKIIDAPDPSGELSRRLRSEARIIARLEHPGIVPVHDAGVLEDGRVFYVMKHVEGDQLDEHVTKIKALSDRLRIFQKVCEAVSFAHARGVLHRDLKPENIMVGQFGEALVMDWGVAKILRGPEQKTETNSPNHSEKSAHTAHGTIVGTRGYMAVEQAEGAHDLDERADVYSLGAVLYFLLTDRAPTHTRPRELNRDLPRAIEAICLKAMAAGRDERYASAQEMLTDVTRFLDGLPVAAYRENVFERAWRWVARNRFLLIL
ncbi:MAG TPA: serine/threonine-protein kinase, partial [Blastocatellia bacterium]